MRIVVAALAILALIAGAAGDAGAQGMPRSGTSTPRRKCGQPRRAATADPPSDYIVRDANQLPVGSSIWWDQMLREDRAGTCCN